MEVEDTNKYTQAHTHTHNPIFTSQCRDHTLEEGSEVSLTERDIELIEMQLAVDPIRYME